MFFEERVAWVISLIKEKNSLTNVQIGEKLGIDKNTVAAYIHGKGDLKGVALAGLVKHYDVNGEWLIAGIGEPFPGARIKFPEACGPESPLLHQPEQPSEDFVFIRQVNGKISAGGGLAPDDTSDVRAAFRRDWIKKKGGKPENMSLIRVDGDSMDPTLLSGDMVLVDHARNVVASQGGIYAISMDHEIMIKRIQVLHDQGKYRIISDNKQYPPQEIDADKVAINGKVLWFAREMER